MRYLLIFAFFISSCTTRYYIFRHAEKAPGTGDVSLSDAGKQRAQALKEKIKGKVQFLTSTNFKRTRETLQPLSEYSRLNIHVYNHTDTVLLERYRKGNVSIAFAGHSNTVDDLVNYFMGEKVMTDLPDTAYGDLFIVVKKGKKFRLERERF